MVGTDSAHNQAAPMRKLLTHIILFVFTFQQLAWADGPDKANDPFSIKGQAWGPVSAEQPVELKRKHLFRLRTPQEKRLYQVVPQSLSDGRKLVIIDLKSKKRHIFPIAAEHITISKNCMFITLPKKIGNDRFGFYVVRMIDFFNFGFKSPVPLFFVPTHRDYGHIQAVIAKHEDRTREVALYIKSEHDDHSLIAVDYDDLTDLIKAQLMTYALNHMMTHPSFKKLIPIIQKFEKETKAFYRDLNTDLSRLAQSPNASFIPQTLKKLDFNSTSVQELSRELSKADKHQTIMAFKERYARRLTVLITSFHAEFGAFLESVEGIEFDAYMSANSAPKLSHELREFIQPGSTMTPPTPKKPWYDVNMSKDEKQAVAIYGVIVASVIMVTFVIPKMLKKPFSEVGANYSSWHCLQINKSLAARLLQFVTPKSLKSHPKYMETIERLTAVERSYEGIAISKDQFRRGLSLATGEAGAVVISELIMRPWLKDPGRPGAGDAILLSEPFDRMHSLWVQKNVLFRLVCTQVTGTIHRVVQLSIMEKGMKDIIANFITSTRLEQHIAQDPRMRGLFRGFAETHKRQLVTTIEHDIKLLRNEISLQLIHMVEGKVKLPEGLTLSSLEINEFINKLKLKWLHAIEGSTGQLTERSRTYISAMFETKIRHIAGDYLEEHLKSTQNAGRAKKMLLAIGTAIQRNLTKVFGEQFVVRNMNLFKKSLHVWAYDFKPTLIHHMILQPAIRGGFNASVFMFNRISCLLLFTPFYIWSYEKAKLRINFGKQRNEIGFGVAYGLVTCIIYNFLFYHIYEQRMKDTAFDLEFDIFKDTDIKKESK